MLQALLMQLSPSALDWAQWAGLLVPPDPGPDSGSGAGELERLLRVKCLLLVAVALKTRAFRCDGWHACSPAPLGLPRFAASGCSKGLLAGCRDAAATFAAVQVAEQAASAAALRRQMRLPVPALLAHLAHLPAAAARCASGGCSPCQAAFQPETAAHP